MAAGTDDATSAWRVCPTPEELDAGELHESTLHRAATALAQIGCVLLDAPMVDAALCERVRGWAAAELAQLLGRVERHLAGVDVLHDRFLTSAICSRSTGGRRYDVRLDYRTSGPPCADLLAQMRRWSAQVLAASGLLGDGAGRTHMAGLVASLPGGCAQGFHTDGTQAGCVNVFCPLVDVTDNNGPTCVVAGSHAWPIEAAQRRADELNALRGGGAPAAGTEAHVLRATMGRGSLLLFDFRAVHRGDVHHATELAAARALGGGVEEVDAADGLRLGAEHAPTGVTAPSPAAHGHLTALTSAARPVVYAVAARPGMELYEFFDSHPPLAP